MTSQPISGLPGYRHLALENVVSTNSEALALARHGEPGGIWVTAERQTGGRGRRGRQWISDVGNLYASLLLVDPAAPRFLGNLPFVAAVAAHLAIDSFFSDRPVRPRIKWPNDILIRNEKIVGILLESEQLPSGAYSVAVGFGVNSAHHPANIASPATDLEACGIKVSAAQLFPVLAASMDRALSVWRRGEGFAEIRSLWLGSVQGIGDRVRVNLNTGSVDGHFERIDDDGHLILRLDDGEYHRISAGDLFFLNPEGEKV